MIRFDASIFHPYRIEPYPPADATLACCRALPAGVQWRGNTGRRKLEAVNAPEPLRNEDPRDQNRQREREYQAFMVRFDQKRRELEREGVNPEEAGYRILAEMGSFHDQVRSVVP